MVREPQGGRVEMKGTSDAHGPRCVLTILATESNPRPAEILIPDASLSDSGLPLTVRCPVTPDPDTVSPPEIICDLSLPSPEACPLMAPLAASAAAGLS